MTANEFIDICFQLRDEQGWGPITFGELAFQFLVSRSELYEDYMSFLWEVQLVENQASSLAPDDEL